VIRVFPRRNKATPPDGKEWPGLFDRREKVHISVTFTWDLDRARMLRDEWEAFGFEVEMGGPALNDPGGEFVPGRYMAPGNVITTRGCPNNCDFCLVPKREGKLRCLEVKEGHLVHDNNILAAPREHWDEVILMLKTQRDVRFVGGFEAARLRRHHVEDLRGLSLTRMYFAYDRHSAKKSLQKAMGLLCDFRRDQLACYVLIGRGSFEDDEARLRECWHMGFMPFAMLYQPPDKWIDYSRGWRELQRKFCRPALTKAVMAVR